MGTTQSQPVPEELSYIVGEWESKTELPMQFIISPSGLFKFKYTVWGTDKETRGEITFYGVKDGKPYFKVFSKPFSRDDYTIDYHEENRMKINGFLVNKKIHAKSPEVVQKGKQKSTEQVSDIVDVCGVRTSGK